MRENLSPGMVDGGDVTDTGPDDDMCSDARDWRLLTQPEMLTVLSALDGVGCSIHIDMKQVSQRVGRCAAYGCTGPAWRSVRGIGKAVKWCEPHHDLVEILLIVRRGWANGQDLLAELARYRHEHEALLKAEAERAKALPKERVVVASPRLRTAKGEQHKANAKAWNDRDEKRRARKRALGIDKLGVADQHRVMGTLGMGGPLSGTGDVEAMRKRRERQKAYKRDLQDRIAMQEIVVPVEDRMAEDG